MFALDKPVGPTAAQALAALRECDPALRGVKLGHAGRLDPMAEGLLTVLVGEENRGVHDLRGQDKTYEVDALFGVETDSFDLLGVVTALGDATVEAGDIERACAGLEGRYLQRYPPYSQAKVGGRSLIALSREGATVERPTAERSLYEVTLVGVRAVELREVCARALNDVAKVRGDFRQPLISERWGALRDERPATRLTVASLRVRCSAGTYMRALAHDLGAALGVASIASRIRRTQAGALTLDGARKIP